MDKPVRYLEAKAISLLVLLALLMCGAITYLMYARGAFDSTQRLVLIAEDSDGVSPGMDLTFSGFVIGRVQRIELAQDGKVHILIDLIKKEARWIRSNSIFTMERGLVGDTRLRAFSGDLSAPLLPDGAVRSVLKGDVSAEIPRLVNSVRTLVDNLERITNADSSLANTLHNVQDFSGRLKGRYGVLGAALGDEQQAQKMLQTLDNVDRLVLRGSQLLSKGDTLLGHADQQIFGANGVRADAQATVQQLNGLLGDARSSLKKVDAVLQQAEAVAGNAKVATADLGQLRAQVELSLRKVEALVNEVNRKWPLARDTELKLP
jgi:phospholipid/cholesterol/gamma-HCH transport system substrate-binding protein